MIDKIPFGLYDFFGYLASGLLIVVGMELVFGFPPILGRDLTVIETAILILGGYVAGQAVATPAKLILEDGLVDKLLRRPSVNLFREKRPRIGRFLFPGYFQQLPEQTRKKILDRAGNEGVTGTGEDLFLLVRYSADIRDNQAIMDRLSRFLANYGFARNLSFTSLIVGIAILARPLVVEHPDPEQVKYGIVALVAGVLLVYRYLKFFRQYSYEMFNAYAGGG
jgi:hypothetical protein